jgi:hypothetical protein
VVAFGIRFEVEKIRSEEVFGEEKLWKVCTRNTKRGGITVLLTSCLTGLESAV